MARRRRRRNPAGWLLTLILLVAAAAWALGGLPTSTEAFPLPSLPAPSVPAPSPTPVPSGVPDATLLATVQALPADEGLALGYERDAFGAGWKDPDRNGCDTRNDMLARDLSAVVFKDGTSQCVVLSGVLDDPYTGAIIEFRRGEGTSELVQIDHVVPLGWAWRHSAGAWTAEQRVAFANDPDNLLAVDGPANSSKSDSGPGEWLPPDASYHCDYARRFTAVLVEYGLGVGAADRAALEGLAVRCGG
ncbi:MAG TPA: HNH endonuclease family protein [Naasia sp.]